MKAIRGKKKGATGETYFLSHANTVIVEEGGTKKTLSQKLGELEDYATDEDIASLFAK